MTVTAGFNFPLNCLNGCGWKAPEEKTKQNIAFLNMVQKPVINSTQAVKIKSQLFHKFPSPPPTSSTHLLKLCMNSSLAYMLELVETAAVILCMRSRSDEI